MTAAKAPETAKVAEAPAEAKVVDAKVEDKTKGIAADVIDPIVGEVVPTKKGKDTLKYVIVGGSYTTFDRKTNERVRYVKDDIVELTREQAKKLTGIVRPATTEEV